MSAAASFKIEANVPIPPASNRGKYVPAIRELSRAQVGASTFIAGTSPNIAGAVASSARTHAGNGWYTVRKVPGGARIWKITEPSRSGGQ